MRTRSELLREPLLRACDALSDKIAQTSPLQRDARRARVTAIRDKVRARTISASVALQDLTRVIED